MTNGGQGQASDGSWQLQRTGRHAQLRRLRRLRRGRLTVVQNLGGEDNVEASMDNVVFCYTP